MLANSVQLTAFRKAQIGLTSVLGQELRNCIVDFLWMIELQVMKGLWKSEDASNVQTVSDSSRH